MNFIQISKKNHYVGSRIEVFTKDLIENFEKYINSSAIGVSDKEPMNEAFTPATILIYPNSEAKDGLKLLIAHKENKNIFGSAFGFIEDIGRIYEGKMEKLYVWEGGVEAQIEMSLEIAEIVFYDLSFITMRGLYMPNINIKARIYAVAYNASSAQDQVIEIEVNEKNKLAFSDKQIGEKVQLHTGKMRAFVGGEGQMDYDEYELRGKISAIKNIYLQSFQKEAFICTIDALHDSDEEFYEFDVLITKEVWQEENPPQIDSFISAYVYFCGEVLFVS